MTPCYEPSALRKVGTTDSRTGEAMRLEDLEVLSRDRTWFKKVSPSPITNVLEVAKAFTKLWDTRPIAMLKLNSSRVERFTELWGEPSFTWKNKYNWKAWVLKLSETEQLVILSAKGGGTTYEVAGGDESDWSPKISDAAQEKLMAILMKLLDEAEVLIK